MEAILHKFKELQLKRKEIDKLERELENDYNKNLTEFHDLLKANAPKEELMKCLELFIALPEIFMKFRSNWGLLFMCTEDKYLFRTIILLTNMDDINSMKLARQIWKVYDCGSHDMLFYMYEDANVLSIEDIRNQFALVRKEYPEISLLNAFKVIYDSIKNGDKNHITKMKYTFAQTMKSCMTPEEMDELNSYSNYNL